MTPDDVKSITAPMLFLIPEHDFMYTDELKDVTKSHFAGSSPDVYKYVDFPGLSHGFAVRGDLKDANQKQGMELARDEVIAWINKHTSTPSAKV